MRKLPLPSQAELKARFDYDVETGRLLYKTTPRGVKAEMRGKPAGGRHCEGGWRVRTGGTEYLHCRLVWVWHFGDDPGDLEIDHIDGDRSNDRLSNLRLATRQQQQWNTKKSRSNTSGAKGVSFYKRLGLWRADITVHGEQKTLGYFKDKLSAVEAYRLAATKLHGEFACLNEAIKCQGA